MSEHSERMAEIGGVDKEVSLPIQIMALVLLVGGVMLVIRTAPPVTVTSTTATSTQVSATAASIPQVVVASTTTRETPSKPATSTVKASVVTPPTTTSAAATENPNQVHRVENPYATAPLSFEQVNEMARASVVNIFCSSKNGLLHPISGSGIIIDPRGVILTNAHVAQYVLLSESGRVNLECAIRAGSPATVKWTPHVLYIPPVWVEEHAVDLTKQRPFGTGKHDFALLYAGISLDGTARPASFPALSPDTREAVAFVDDSVLAASYPAEFLGSITTNFNLYHVTSITKVDELFTLGANTVDVLSIGGVIGAQSGSSGGAIVNAWGRLVGVITTTSDGTTTGDRKLRGITLSYINRDLLAQSGYSLSSLLMGDPAFKVAEFATHTSPALVEKLLNELN